jgi:cytidyltransferase-like protein
MLQAEELIQEIQKGLLMWYKFIPDSTILYFGEEQDSYISLLKEQAKRLICIPADQAAPKEWRQNYIHAFDYIIAIETLENYHEPKEVLKSWKKLLKTDGTILLGMNNRFALRYFCGDRDPYTGRNFDGVENYRRAYSKKEDQFHGRCYSRAEIREFLQDAGMINSRFYSVLPDLKNPSLIYAEDYLPNEDLANRLFPTYNYPNTVFLEEESIYNGLIKNGMFHEMANAYLIECSLQGRFSDVVHTTSSIERGRANAILTIIHRLDYLEQYTVEKRAVYPEGREGLNRLYDNGQDLSAHGISVVEAKLEKDSYIMPYMDCEVGQLYLKRLLHTDHEKFLRKMDEFRDLILHSSEIVQEDVGDGEGAILRKGYVDLVPLNSFYKDDTFIFYDQEFCEENYPANGLIWRMIATFYAGDMEVQKLMPMDILLDRYDLKRRLEKWQRMEWDFLADLRQEKILRKYHERYRRNYEMVNSNRQRLNYSADEYQKLFVDIFRNSDTRKLILFGSGNFTKRFLNLYRQDYPVYAIIDNNKEKWGQKIEGIEIQSPEILRCLQSGEYKVLICIKNYLSVMKQLNEMGVKEYSIFDSSKDYPRKRKPIIQEQSVSQKAGGRKKYHTGYVAGVFDLFHVGHLNMFRRAKEQCEYLIVGVVSDEGVRKFKHTDPFVSFEERIELVRACRYVDEAIEIPLNFGGTRDAWRLHHFDCQFSGSDYADNPEWLEEKEFLEEHGAEMVFFPYTEKTNSTRIKALIEKRLL